MIQRRILTGLLVAVVIVAVLPFFSLAEPKPSLPVQEGTNVLRNPGFEGLSCGPNSQPGWCDDNWDRQTHDGSIHDNIFTPQGWVTWWRKGGGFGQPEIKTIPRVDPFIGPPARVNSGNYAALLFTFYRDQDAGFYQTVTGLQPGASVQFSSHGHGWACDEDGSAYSCGDPWSQTFQVGIEPNGVADPFSPSVIWSEERPVPDAYSLIGPVTAQVGEGGSVVVFLRSKSKWPLKHLDAYWDDSSLVTTAQGTPPTVTPPPAPPTATPGPPPTPRPTPTPRPDGAIVHVVEPGDTLFGIALQYDVSADEIRRLNAGSIGENNLIVVGQELVISLPGGVAPTSTPLPAPPTTAPTSAPESPSTEEEVTGEGEAVAEAESGGASICVLAYHDRDASTSRDPANEELLPNANFVLSNDAGVVQEYTSDGISEPYCFTGLASGAYRVTENAPAGYRPSGPSEWPAALAEGTSLELQFGNARDSGEEAPPDEAPAPGPEEETGESGGGSGLNVGGLLSTVAKISGVLVLVLAAGIAVLFVLTRRRG